ncbi:MAG: hypothetical protein OJF59_000961 [Cytophagales bacterium]|jgi:predicted Zn-dependent protease|nr:M48 family metallopeptidase [Bacteroidota bacterium]MBS1980042.1 M48 family metallopeptidase [Bacteroidota bacterium]WHZ07208.1 MAG: hypothetical protein OJF59_000961 [Cytophagales bacterium]
MNKILLQFFITVAVFATIYFGLSQIDWIAVLKVKEASKKTEEKLGDFFWELFSKADEEIHDEKTVAIIDSLVNHLCEANSIDQTKIKIHILKNGEVNAFTLPNNYLVIYSGLIKSTENEAELLGVVGHELAHMEKGHVMKKLIKEIGLSALISMTAGGGGQTVKEALKLLSSSAYDRDLEREADITSVEYMIRARIDPEPFANFMYRLSDKEKNLPSQAYWISTHPDSKERAEYIINYIKGKTFIKKPLLTESQWKELKERVKN